MSLEAEVICFCNPKVEVGVTLFVAGFPSKLSREDKWIVLHTAFAQFGLIHQIQFPSSETQPFAFVTFYSSVSAARARAALNQVLCVDNKLLKVQSARESRDIEVAKRLPYSKCCELANYYLGFNGWSICTVSNSCSVGETAVTCHCIVMLKVKELKFTGQAEEVIVFPENIDLVGRLSTIGLARKWTHQHACENCFSDLVLVSLPNGKVAVQKLCDD